MRILFVSSGNSHNGISPIIKNQGDSITNQGVKVEYYTIKGKGLKSYYFHIFRLRKYLKTNKYEIIHAHYGLCGIICLLAKRKEKLIVSFMGDDLLGSNKTNGSILLFSLLMAFINKWLSRIFYHATIVKSQEMVIKHGNTDSLYLAPNGIDIRRFLPLSKEMCRKKLNWNNNQYHVLFAANPDRIEKNFHFVKDAVNLISMDLEINLQYLKDVPHCDIPYYMNASDLVILCSFHEGSPNVIKEAMACNCPIVSTNVGDVKWIFGETKGCFITDFELCNFADKIKKGLEFRKETLGRKRIIELRLDSESVAENIINIYCKLLN